MDINNNQLTNTFEGGMNTDTSDMYIQNDQYRYAENLRFITNQDSNTGELHTIEGFKRLYFPNFAESPEEEPGGDEEPVDDNTWDVNGDGVVIKLGESEVTRTYGSRFIITGYEILSARYDDGQNASYGHVETPDDLKEKIIRVRGESGPAKWFNWYGEVEYNTPNSTPVYVTLSEDDTQIKFSLNDLREGLINLINTVWPINIKFHVWGEKLEEPAGARGSNEPIVNELSFSKVYGTTVIRNYGVLIANIQGEDGWSILRYNDEDDTLIRVFGPCTDPIGEDITMVSRWESDDNVKVYIADGINLLMSVNIVKPKENTSINAISSSILYLPEVIALYRIPGNLRPAAVQYCYRIYLKYQMSSSMSLLSGIILLYNTSGDVDKGVLSNKHTERGVRVSIKIDQEYSNYNILLFRIQYIEVGQLPDITLVYDGKIFPNTISDKFVFDDATDTGISSISVAEFLGFDGVYVIPKLIESKNDYLFAANLRYYDPQSYNIYTNIDSTSRSTNNDGNQNLDMSLQYDISKWRVYDSENLEWVIGGNGTIINWRLLYRSVTSENKHIGDVNYEGNITNSTPNTLRRDEIYRYGIVLYDKCGQRWPVKWIADIRTPSANIEGYNPFPNQFGLFGFGNIYIRFDVNLTDEQKSVFPAYEIVRCKRNPEDRSTISQGIVANVFQPQVVSRTLYNDTQWHETGYICPTGLGTSSYVFTRNQDSELVNDDFLMVKALPATNFVQFFSPECAYTPDYIKDILDENNTYLDYLYNGVAITSEFPFNTDQDGNAHAWAGFNQMPIGHTLVTDSVYTFYGTSNDNINRDKGLSFYSDENFEIDVLQYNFYKSHPEGGYLYSNGDWLYDSGEYRIKDGYGIKLIHNKLQLDFRYGLLYISGKSSDIDSSAQIIPPDWSSFSNGNRLSFMDSLVEIGDKTFVSWSVPTIMTLDSHRQALLEDWYKTDDRRYYVDDENGLPNFGLDTYRYPIGKSGRSFVFYSKEGFPTDNKYQTTDSKLILVSVANLKRKNFLPYGGFTDVARTSSNYISIGCYKRANDDEVLIDYGDSFLCFFYCNILESWHDALCINAPKMATTAVIPLETDIDIYSDCGDSYRLNPNPEVQDLPSQFKNYTQDKPAYLYNTAYGTQTNVRLMSGQDVDSNYDTNKYDYRVVYSGIKTNNELIDSWTKFLPANFLDVDTRFGELTHLRLFKDSLIYWQEHATGVLSVNERTVLQDVNDTNIILGNGDVLQRYDYLTTEFGMKPTQHVETLSNTTLYWWDGYKKEILGYSGGYNVQPMNKVKNVSDYINSNDESENPEMAYDFKYNEVLMNVVNDESLVYSEVTQVFTSIYSICFDHNMRFKDRLMLINDGKFEAWNEGSYSLRPLLWYVVNHNPQFVKTFDISLLGLGESWHTYIKANDATWLDEWKHQPDDKLDKLLFNFYTKGQSAFNGLKSGSITSREYDYRFTIPRSGNAEYGNRMRGKVMRGVMILNDYYEDFSIQYITTKYRISYS